MDIVLLVISIVGCVTGIISLLIVILYNTFQIGKQKISVSDRRGTYYFKTSDTTVKGPYNSTICAVVSLKVTNCSSYPITIDDAYISSKRNRHLNGFQFENIEVTGKDGISWRDTEEIVCVPLKLDPFETKYLAFAFPFFEKNVNEYGKPVKASLTIITARKAQSLSVTIPEYYSLFEHAQKMPSPRS